MSIEHDHDAVLLGYRQLFPTPMVLHQWLFQQKHNSILVERFFIPH